MLAVFGISLGAALGALLRWRLGSVLNIDGTPLPMGTLVANLLGGYLIGIAITFFARVPMLAPEWRLFAITGFLGGLTTFSTFSAEVTAQLQAERFGWAAATIASHVVGSLCMTLIGIASCSWLATK